MEKQYIVGSQAFFSGMPDFHTENCNVLNLIDESNDFEHYQESVMPGLIICDWVRKPKDEFLKYAMRDNADGQEFGKFLVPEFAAEIGLTIDDLTTLYDFYETRIYEVNNYQKSIFESYRENGDFVLTDIQREDAYNAYKTQRQNFYPELREVVD